ELRAVADMRVPSGLGRVAAAIWSLVTLGGHLLPPRFDRRPLRAAPVQHRVLGASPGRRAILYRDPSGSFRFVATRDRLRFLGLFTEMLLTAIRIVWSFNRVRRSYREA